MISQKLSKTKVTPFLVKRGFSTSINEREKKFYSEMTEWWDLKGPMKGLHAYDVLRREFIKDHIMKQYKMIDEGELGELTHIDVGCGGGLLCETMAKYGLNSTGLDPIDTSYHIAKNHAEKESSDLLPKLNYVNKTIEDYIEDSTHKEAFDVATSMEVVEHVDNQEKFVKDVIKTIKPGGMLFMSTIAKNWLSWIVMLRIGEDILGVLPKGTHQYEKFINAEDLCRIIEDAGCEIVEVRGTKYNPFSNVFSYTKLQKVSYMLAAIKK